MCIKNRGFLLGKPLIFCLFTYSLKEIGLSHQPPVELGVGDLIYARRNLLRRMCLNSKRTGGIGNSKRIIAYGLGNGADSINVICLIFSHESFQALSMVKININVVERRL